MAPMPFTSMKRLARGSCDLRQCTTMPALGKREGQERADGVEGNQPVGDAAEDDEQDGGQHGQHVNALRIDQAAAAHGKRVGEIAVLRDDAAEAGEIGESGVGGERQNQKDGGDADPVKPSAPGDGGEQHREDALVAGGAGVGGADVVGADQEGDAEQHNGQDGNDDGEGELRGFGDRFAKGPDAVADGFDAGHGGAAAGEGFQDQPGAEARGGGGHGGRRDHGVRMAAAAITFQTPIAMRPSRAAMNK